MVVTWNVVLIGKVPQRRIPRNVIRNDETVWRELPQRLLELEHHLLVGVIGVVEKKINPVEPVDQARQQQLRVSGFDPNPIAVDIGHHPARRFALRNKHAVHLACHRPPGIGGVEDVRDVDGVQTAFRSVLGQRQHHERARQSIADARLHNRLRFGLAHRPVQELGIDKVNPAGLVFRAIAPLKLGDIALDEGFALHHLVETGHGAGLVHRFSADLPPGTRRHPVPLRKLLDLKKQRVGARSIDVMDVVRKVARELRVVIGVRGVVGPLGKQQRRCPQFIAQRAFAAAMHRPDNHVDRDARGSA